MNRINDHAIMHQTCSPRTWAPRHYLVRRVRSDLGPSPRVWHPVQTPMNHRFMTHVHHEAAHQEADHQGEDQYEEVNPEAVRLTMPATLRESLTDFTQVEASGYRT